MHFLVTCLAGCLAFVMISSAVVATGRLNFVNISSGFSAR